MQRTLAKNSEELIIHTYTEGEILQLYIITASARICSACLRGGDVVFVGRRHSQCMRLVVVSFPRLISVCCFDVIVILILWLPCGRICVSCVVAAYAKELSNAML